jgi:hypothetical protein
MKFDVTGDRPPACRNVLLVEGIVRLALVSTVFAIILGMYTSAFAQACRGDCDGDRTVALAELVMGVGAALGARPIEDCEALDVNLDHRVSIEELLSAVNEHLTDCARKAIGQCMRAGPRGLEPCPEGMEITVSRCTDAQRCLVGQGGLVVLDFGTIGAQGRFELDVSARESVGASLVFEVEVESGTKYRTLSFGRISAAGGAGLVVDLLIDPVSEAAVRLIAENGFENFTDDEVAEVFDAVRLANVSTDFVVANAEEGARRATEVARTDPGVMAAIEAALEPPVSRGLRFVTAGNLRAANRSFREAVESDPADTTGNALYAATRIATIVFDDPRLAALRNRAGVRVTGDASSLCDIVVELPRVSDAVDELPGDAPTSGEILRTLRNVLLPELLAAQDNLANIPSNFVLTLNMIDLPECIRPARGQVTLEIDYADVLLLDAALEAASAAFDLGDSYDLDTELRPLFTAKEREVFERAPKLFTLTSAAPLTPARSSLESSLSKFVQVLDTIAHETDDQGDDLLIVTPNNLDAADIVATSVDLLRMSFTAAVTLPTTIGLLEAGRLDLRPFFAGQLTALQPFFPKFDDDGDFLCSTCFDDPTFGGMLPDVQCEDPMLACTEIEEGAKGIGRKYRGLATGECAPCEFDEDCKGTLGSDVACFPCSKGCVGTTNRCAPHNRFARCDDGSF